MVFAIMLIFIGAGVGSNISGVSNYSTDLANFIENEQTVNVNVHTVGEITQMDFNIVGFDFETININDKDYVKIVMDDESNKMEKGYPDIPDIRRSIIIPDDTKMGAEVLWSDYQEYDNILIAPSKGVITRNINPDDVPYIFDDMYYQDEWYPNDLVELNDPYILRDFRGQVVIVNPFQYNPVTQKLRVYTDISVKVEPVAPGEINVFNRNKPLDTFAFDAKNIYSRHFENFNDIDYRLVNIDFPSIANNQFSYTPVEEEGNMVVITYDNFYSAVEPFVEWKNMKGIPTELVKFSDIGTTADDIYNYIVNYYNTYGLTFVLLVGDAAQIPPLYQGGDESDPSYSFIVGSDKYPDLFVGRFSAETIADVETQVLKSVEYEKYPQNSATWYKKGVGIASNQGPGDDNEMDNEHVDVIRSKLLAYTYTHVDQIYDPSGTDTDVSNALNDGRSIINYCGHGSTTSWGSTGFNNNDVNALVNDNMLPFIVSVACVNGNFGGTTCFAEAWLRATNGAEPTGAIATFMSSVNQGWNPPMSGQDEFNDILVESYANNIKHSFGALTANGCMQMNDDYGSSGTSETDHWTLFGDPSIQVRTDTPGSITVIHDDTIETTATTFDVTVVGVEKALCAISRNGDLYGFGYTDSSGHATIQLDQPISNPGLADLVVTAYNKQTYLTTIDVISVDFSWDPPYPNTNSPINFIDQTQGTVLSWYWEFGDGTTSTQQNPTHTYSSQDTYNVGLTVVKPDGTYSLYKEVAVKINWEPIVIATPEEYAGNNPVVNFDGSESWDPDGYIASFEWDFDDGATSTDISPTHTFTDDGIYTVVLTATDDKSKEGTDTCTMWIDFTTPPVTTMEGVGSIGNNGWFLGKSTKIVLSATDWSGVDHTKYREQGSSTWQTYDAPFRVWGDGTHIIEFYSVDIYGNVEDVKTDQVKMDNEKPSLEVDIDGILVDEWYTTPVTITATASDSGSGLAAIMYTFDENRFEEYTEPIYLADDGQYILRIYSEDIAGNTRGKDQPYPMKIDTGAPMTTCTLIGEGSDGNYYQEVDFELIAEDHGSGVDKTYYRLDDSEWNEYTSFVKVSDMGEHKLDYYSVDMLGNEEEIKTIEFTISNINFNLKITNPDYGLYLFGNQFLYIQKTILIGAITVEATLTPYGESPTAVEYVDFIVDDEIKATVESAPFEWNWDYMSFGPHTLKIVAYNEGDSVEEIKEVTTFIF